jgi:hypothetical protein
MISHQLTDKTSHHTEQSQAQSDFLEIPENTGKPVVYGFLSRKIAQKETNTLHQSGKKNILTNFFKKVHLVSSHFALQESIVWTH